MARWIGILWIFLVCVLNDTYSQMIDDCEKLNECNTLLSNGFTNGELLEGCRTILYQYLPCMQGVRTVCPDVSQETFDENTADVLKIYNNSNCGELLKEVTTSTKPSQVPVGTSGLSSKGPMATRSTLPPDSRTREVSEGDSGPKEMSSAAIFITSGTSLNPDGVTTDVYTPAAITDMKMKTDQYGVKPQTPTRETDQSRVSPQTPTAETGTSVFAQRFKSTSASMITTNIPDRLDSTTISRSTRPEAETTKLVPSDVTNGVDTIKRHSALPAYRRSTQTSSSSFVPEVSTNDVGLTKRTAQYSVDTTKSGTRLPATRSSALSGSSFSTGTSVKSSASTRLPPLRGSSGITHHSSGKVTSSTARKTSKTVFPSTIWPKARLSSSSVKAATSTSSDRSGKLPTPSTEKIIVDADTSGVLSVQTVCLQTLILVLISYIIVT